MKKSISILLALVMIISVFAFAACGETDEPVIETEVQETETETQETETEVQETRTPGAGLVRRRVTDGITEFYVVENPGDGPTLSFAADSGIGLIVIEYGGYELAFRDLNGNGTLEPWEDWRLDSMTRATYLVSQLSVEQLSGLMLFGPHEFGLADGLTERQREYIGESHVRALLHAGDNNVSDSVRWVNAVQAFIEETAVSGGLHLIPAILASDPRSTPHGGHTLALDPARFAEPGTGDVISQWPENLGLAALHDPARAAQAAAIQAIEYRALGISWALGPQVDLASDPRWGRNWQTFGEDVTLSSDIAAAFVEAMQANGVATTIKHFPADGAGEGGRASTALDGSGAFAVFPGGAQDDHLAVFMAALDTAAIMTSFAVNIDALGQPIWGDEAWSVAYNHGEIALLRDAGWEGVVVTDWFVPADPERPILPAGRRWGMEAEDWAGIPAEEYYRILSADVDVFGGMNNLQRILEAFDIWEERYASGYEYIDALTRWQQTGTRVLNLLFNSGNFDNPFVDLEESLRIAGSADKIREGINAQIASVVMLKNDGVVTEANFASLSDLTVYVPSNYTRSFVWQMDAWVLTYGPSLSAEMIGDLVGAVLTDETVLNETEDAVEAFIVPDLSDVDVIIVGMTTPEHNGGFSPATGQFIPVSLQWRPYTADGPNVRRQSIGGLMLPDGTRENRSYFGNTGTVTNENHLDTLERVAAAVAAAGRDIPIIVVLHGNGPSTFVPTEIYDLADAILIGYHVAQQALVEVALGLHEPTGRLPIGLPASMDAVEASYEDVGRDHAPFIDSHGNAWHFGFGLNWSGLIQ